MEAIAESAVQELYRRARIAASQACGALKLATAIFGERCVQIVHRGALPGRGALARSRPVIHVREGLTGRQVNHCVAHELGEWHLHTTGHAADPDAEELVGSIAAAICVPRPAFEAAQRALGNDLGALSRAFLVSESLMALRIAECRGTATALITRRRIRTRGTDWGWPSTPDGWRVLLDGAHAQGLIVERLRDARGRLVVRADDRKKVEDQCF
jgi:hypothetical protein